MADQAIRRPRKSEHLPFQLKFERSSQLPFSAETLYHWHLAAGAFERLVPPWDDVRILDGEMSISEGSRRTLGVRKGPLTLPWVALHYGFEEGRQFIDEQLRGPFAQWVHRHRFEPMERGSLLHDQIEYRFPLDLPGHFFLQPMLERMFRYRHQRTLRDLERHQGVPSQKIALTGASGMVGSQLKPFLTTGGHQVVSLVRHEPRRSDEVRWLPKPDLDRLEGFDTVIHLAGRSVATYWSEKHKRQIYDSRVDGTETLCRALSQLKRPPKTLICASAIGYYGHRQEQVVDETSMPGEGFLAEVCKAWERATTPAEEAGLRVVQVRIGVVLGANGGALAAQVLPFSLGLGAVVGDGRQWMSWISLDDLIGLLYFCLSHEVSGPVNAVAPQPVTQAQFATCLGRVLGRPVLARVPAALVKAGMGEASAMLLDSTRVAPRVYQDLGFEPYCPDLESALRWELGRPSNG